MAETISRERAVRIARSHACSHCLEYSFKRLSAKAASPSQQAELKAVWVVERICGVCGLETEMGLDDDGDVVFLG